jgi:integrase
MSRIRRADALLFFAENGAPLDYSNWRRVWLPAVKKTKLGNVGFHDLRRANATSLVTSRVDLKTAQRLGRSDPRLTLAVYAQATTDADRAPRTRSANGSRTKRGRNAD